MADRVWLTFTAKKDQEVRFRVQDCPQDRYGDFMRFMVEHFMRDETLNETFGIQHDPLAIQEFTDLQSSYFVEKLALICVLDDDNPRPDIIGVNLMTVLDADKPSHKSEVKSKAMTNLFRVFEELDRMDDVFDRFNVRKVLGDAGLSVHPDYRGLNVATELLNAKTLVCRSLGLKVGAAAFSSAGSQRAAEKSGYIAYQQLPYAQIEEMTDTPFNATTTHIKLMARLV